MALTVLHNVSVKRQVKLRTNELRQTNLVLENEVSERKRAEQGATRLLAEKRFLAQKCMAVQEDERRHLAGELHDELGQCITAIQAEAETIQELSSDSRVLASAGAIQSVSARIFAVVHTIMERLRPSILDDLGLIGIRERVEALDGKFDISSSTGAGTRIEVTVPLPQSSEATGEPDGHNQSLAG